MARQPLPLEEGVCGAMLHHRSFQPNAASPDHQIMTGSGAKPQPTPSRAQIHPLCHKHAARPHPTLTKFDTVQTTNCLWWQI